VEPTSCLPAAFIPPETSSANHDRPDEAPQSISTAVGTQSNHEQGVSSTSSWRGHDHPLGGATTHPATAQSLCSGSSSSPLAEFRGRPSDHQPTLGMTSFNIMTQLETARISSDASAAYNGGRLQRGPTASNAISSASIDEGSTSSLTTRSPLALLSRTFDDNVNREWYRVSHFPAVN
jgi:hypothetical protein